MRDPQKTKQKGRLTGRRLVLRVVFTVVIVLLTGEIAMRAAFAVFNPHEDISSLLDKERSIMQHTAHGRRKTEPNVLHPYVGFVVDPTQTPGFNQLGFWQVDGPILKRTPDTFIVGITGGSVALNLCQHSHQALRQALAARLPGQSVRIVCLAQEGFREPQLAMAVAWFQTLGAEFDAIVSLSGFNEATLHPAEAAHDLLWLGYPRKWNIRLMDTEEPQISRLIWMGQSLQTRRQQTAQQFYRFHSLRLMLIHGVWCAIDGHYVRELGETVFELSQERSRMTRRYANTGPFTEFDSAEHRRESQCRMWLSGARQIDRLCDAANARFLLCLQPNLQDSRKKFVTDEEQKLISEGSLYAEFVHQNYSYFAEAAAQLNSEGIHFTDLRDVFAEITETVYSDACCHFNAQGSDIIAERLAIQLTGVP